MSESIHVLCTKNPFNKVRLDDTTRNNAGKKQMGQSIGPDNRPTTGVDNGDPVVVAVVHHKCLALEADHTRMGMAGKVPEHNHPVY